ncbi:MAG: hypothetical protein ABSH28_03545 [Acidobacteriota bacterium]
MKQAAALLLVAPLLLYAACVKKKVEPPKFWDLYSTGGEILALDRYDTKAEELIRDLKVEVDVARPKAANEAEANILRLYGNVAETFHLAMFRSRVPATGTPQKANAFEAQSSSDLWNTAKDQLRAAQGGFLLLHRLRIPMNQFNQFFDPPIKANKPPNYKYQYPWPR